MRNLFSCKLQITRKIDTKSGLDDSSTKPSSATLKIGDEVFRSENKLAAHARHAVMIKTLNETRYRYTNIPGALRTYVVDKTIKDGNKANNCVRNDPQSGVNDKQEMGVKDKLDTTGGAKDKVLSANQVSTPISVSKKPVYSMNEECILSKNQQYKILNTMHLTAGICGQLLGLLAQQNHVRFFHIHIKLII